MRFSHKLLLSVLLSTSIQTVQAHQEQDEPSIGQQIDGAINTVKEFSADNKDQAIEKVDSALTRLDKRIEELEQQIQSKWQTMDNNARQEAQDSLDTLHTNRERVANWVAQLKASSSDTFNELKSSVSGAFSALQDSWKNTEEAAPQSDTDSNKIITI